ncbi:response regulator [Corallococcus sp. AB018]|uniref:Response regulator n=1 Tax=Corallococcus exiguus TaxID=83462 RepID=A0A7X4YEG7_9BACT|nr:MULTISPECIES: response regulator [Corallococcus]NBC43958.1 response regulator [Corallococcus exiguus]RKH23071.1 response regulator [Corallococcus sp. CA041A]RUO88872.1 response regulator [Corallococcus sp. AB018]TNV60692.1 response regulator [Corallococcus exiguus]
MGRFLLVDDNRAFAENLAEILEDAGHSATVVDRGDAALQAAREERYDVLITDMRMAGMSGAALVHHLRQRDPGLAAIVITAHPGEAELARARAEGVLAVLPKPVPVPALVELLTRARRDGLVVLVEDDVRLADNLTEVLRERGFTAVVAHSVPDVVGLEPVRPFAALVDLRVPGGPDGEALRRVQERFPGTTPFVVTAYPEALPADFEGRLVRKPFDTGALLAELEQVHGGRA